MAMFSPRGKLIKLSAEGVLHSSGPQKNQPVVSLMMMEVPLSGTTLKWLRMGFFFFFLMFIQEPGADNGALMIGSWLQVNAAEHSRMCHGLIKNQKLMGALSHLFLALNIWLWRVFAKI